jgi:hypothetical protein
MHPWNWLNRLTTPRRRAPRAGTQGRLRQTRFRPVAERLEDRLTPATNTTFVDDNWQDLSRNTGSPMIGDIIQNTNDTINPGGITAAYGYTGFGTVLVGSTPGTGRRGDHRRRHRQHQRGRDRQRPGGDVQRGSHRQ